MAYYIKVRYASRFPDRILTFPEGRPTWEQIKALIAGRADVYVVDANCNILVINSDADWENTCASGFMNSDIDERAEMFFHDSSSTNAMTAKEIWATLRPE